MANQNIIDSNQPVAAIDLGSNSFHMVVARIEQGQLVIIDRIREMVRLAAGLDKKGHLSEDVAIRALSCLSQFKQRLENIPASNIAVVGTNTFRKARNARQFLDRAEYALGHSIGIISGHEEARLIYLGVSHSVANNDCRRFVVDIGGGSTEIIIGEGFEPLYMESLFVGCVGITQSCFKNGLIKSKQFDKAETKVMLELSPYIAKYKHLGWQEAVGSSGTIRAISKVLLENGWTDGMITLEGLEQLKSTILKIDNIADLSLPGLSTNRTPVFPGGVAILIAIFKLVGIDKMQVSTGSVREGVLFDLLGRTQNHDVRNQAIEQLIARFSLDKEHLKQIQRTCSSLFLQVAEKCAFSPSDAMLLNWAVSLHEIGLSISHDQYHKHGAYILENLDLAGFTRQEQSKLALLVKNHRKSIRYNWQEKFSKQHSKALLLLVLLLRLAVLLNRSRNPESLDRLTLKFTNKKIKLNIPEEWLATHPLTKADLLNEARYLEKIDWELDIN